MFTKEAIQTVPKYVEHAKTGCPIRLAPYIRSAVRENQQDAHTVLHLVQNTPFIGERNEEDFAQNNIEHNKKLRRIARQVLAPELAAFAESKGAKQYCAIVYGSLSRGLVRHPENPDKSDIDTAIVVDDDTSIGRDEKEVFEEKLRGIGSALGVPVGCRIHTIGRAKLMVGQLARTYLECSAYPLVNQNGMWEQVYSLGLSAATFTQFGPSERRMVRKLIEEIITHDYENAQKRYERSIASKPHLHAFLEKHGLFLKNAETYAKALYELIQETKKNDSSNILTPS